jgi:O-antigen ligase
MLAIPQLGMTKRVNDVALNINQYLSGNVNTSVGARFEMWKGAWQMFVENPLLGVGRSNFNEGLNALIARHMLDPVVHIYHHAHNDILQALATQGLIGIFALGALYIAPLSFFMRCWRRHDAAQPYALAGILLIVSYVISGLTQVMFAHHLGTAFYSTATGMLVGLCILNGRRELPGQPLPERRTIS